MGEAKFHLKAITAAELATKLLAVAKDVAPTGGLDQFTIDTNIGGMNFIYDGAQRRVSDFEETDAFKKTFQRLSDRPYLDALSATLRVNQDWWLSYHDNQKDAVLTLHTNHDNVDQRIPVVDAIHKHFNILRHVDAIESRLPDAQRDVFEFMTRTIGDFATQAAKLSQTAAENTEKLSTQIQEKTVTLDDRYLKKEADLEARYQAKFQELEDRVKKHQEEVAKFDARNNTVVRRELLSKISSMIDAQKALTLSGQTIKKRRLIHIICISTLVAFFGIAASFTYKLLIAAAFDWHYAVPLATSTAVVVSTLIYYIRWNDDWFEDHAQAEFSNRKFSADILRASWIAELLFEWDSKKEKEFPADLVSRLATNLFVPDQTAHGTNHPYEELTEVLKRVSSVEIGKGTLKMTRSESAK